MRIEISHKYSDMDNCHQFGIEFFDGANCSQYIRWVYYYLGVFFGEDKSRRLYPYSINGKGIKKYKYCNDAQRQAKTIFNYISRKSQK